MFSQKRQAKKVISSFNVTQQHLERKLSTLPDFVNSMRTLLSKQRQEIEMVSMGEYCVLPKYSHLAYEHTKWFTMSPKQRQAKDGQFMKHTVEEENTTKTCRSKVDINPLTGSGLPSHVANTIWNRAHSLVQEDSAIIKAPGDDTAFMVKSISGQHPDYVKTTKKGGFACALDSSRPDCAPTQWLLQ